MARGQEQDRRGLQPRLPPLRLQPGSGCVALVESKLDTVRDELDRWRGLSLNADYPADAS